MLLVSSLNHIKSVFSLAKSYLWPWPICDMARPGLTKTWYPEISGWLNNQPGGVP